MFVGEVHASVSANPNRKMSLSPFLRWVLVGRGDRFYGLPRCTVWSKDTLGFAGSKVASDAIEKVIIELLEKFANEYLAANGR